MAGEAFTAMFFFLTFFGMIFGIVYMRNKENMALIEKGFNPRQQKEQRDYRPRPFINLKYGLLMVGSGLGLLSAYLIDTLALNHHTNMAINSTNISIHNNDNPAIYFALIAVGGGIGLVLSYAVEKKEWLDKRKEA